jgi:hypothetical protein
MEANVFISNFQVVQEFALAKRAIFICGSKMILAKHAGFGCLFAEIAMVRLSPELLPLITLFHLDPMDTLTYIRRIKTEIIAGTHSGYPLYHLLRHLCISNDMHATEACDHIFALLGLSSDANDLGIRVDYALKDRTDLVFARTTKAMIASGNLDILTMAQHPKLRSELPSWVPDFTSRMDASFVDQPLYDMTPLTLFNASEGHALESLGTTDELELGLTGFIVDEVEETGDVWDGGGITDYDLPDLRATTAKLSVQAIDPSTKYPDETGQGAPQVNISGVPYAHTAYHKYLSQVGWLCKKSARKNKDIYSGVERRAEAVWRVPIGGLEYDDIFDDTRATAASATAYRLCKRAFDFLDGYQSLPVAEVRRAAAIWEDDEATRQPGKYRTRMSCMKNKRPFLTREGYVGMGPRCMEAGDVVVVLGGAALPYVARRVDGKAKKYLLLGECYCDGIMDGEIVGKRPVETFFFV